MRGKEEVQHMIREDDRITPAYAGKSLNDVLVPFVGKDPPRLCGEKAFSTSSS